MGRKRVCPETLRESGTQRKETFTKRTRGLFKKAHELSAMCGCAVYLAVAGEDGRLFHLHRLRNPHLDELGVSRALLDFQPSVPVPAMAAMRDDDVDAAGIDFSIPQDQEIASDKGDHGVQVVAPLNIMRLPQSVSASPSPSANNFASPSSCNSKLWFYNHATEKMEYSGIDSALPIDPSSACFPVSPCPCADCCSGRSRFVGRINSTAASGNIDGAVATPTFDMDATAYDIASDGATESTMERLPPQEFYYYAPYKERLNSMSAPISSADSSTTTGNTDATGNTTGSSGDDAAHCGYAVEPKLLPKVESLEDLDFLFPSIGNNPSVVSFDSLNWFDHPDFKV